MLGPLVENPRAILDRPHMDRTLAAPDHRVTKSGREEAIVLMPNIFDLPNPAETALSRELSLGLDVDFAPARRWGAAGSVGVYVACRLREGAGLFDAVMDPYVQQRADEHPDLLAELAADSLVRDAVADHVEAVAVRPLLVAA